MRNLYQSKHYPALQWAAMALIVFFIGCYTPEKAVKQTDKALNKYPDKVAPKFREAFPCEEMKIDTVHDWQNSTVWVECPPPPVFTETGKDTIYLKGKNYRVPATVKIERITITKTVKDSAEIFVLKDTIANLKASLFMYKHNYENCERLRTEESIKYQSPWYLLFALLFSVFANVMQLRKSKRDAKTK